MPNIVHKLRLLEQSSITMDNQIDLSALQAFRTVVRNGSFACAALVLRMPRSTLSKRIADLEADLGVRLIERSTRSLRVTAEGAVLAARADRLLGDAEDIRRAMRESGAAPRGHLRIAVPTLIGHLVMGGLAARFRAAHPDITLEILFLDRPPDLLEEGFDGALQFTPLDDKPDTARPILQAVAQLVCAPGLPGAAGLKHPSALENLPLVGLASGWTGTWTQLTGPQGATFQITAAPQLGLGSLLAVRDAVIAGAGFGLLPRLLARPAIASGHLIPVLPDWHTMPKTMFFVYPTPQSLTARLRTFIDFVEHDLMAISSPA